MALVNQKQASSQNPLPRQGNANYILYGLAQQQNTANLLCNSSSAPASGCSFNDITKGNNAVPCSGASPNCSSKTAGANGVLVSASASSTPAYTSTPGYDLATGLGTINAQNLVNKWSSVNTTPSATTLLLNNGSAVNITHGQSIPFKVSVSPTAATGDVSIVATPASGNSTGLGPFTLQSGVVSGSTTSLPGGTQYSVVAHYQGNGTYFASDSTPVIVTIAPEASKVLITIPVFDPNTGRETSTAPTTLVYGSPYIARADVTNGLGIFCSPPRCPSGTVTFTDTVAAVNQGPPNSGIFKLNDAGYTENVPVQYPGGTNIITATYSGDSSFAAPAQPTTYTLNVTPAPTQMSQPYFPYSPELVGTPVDVSAFLITNLIQGTAPTGTVTFYDGTSPISGSVTAIPRAGGFSLDASISASMSVTFSTSGPHSITAKYSGDPSYASSTSASWDATVLWPTTMTQTVSSTNINYGQPVTVTATLTTTGKTPVITGQFQFSAPSYNPAPVTPVRTVDSSGNQILTASATFTPQASGSIQVGYRGDANYQGSGADTFIDVTAPDFSMNATPTSLTISSGQQATAIIAITPLTSMGSTVALSCTNPVLFGVTCSVAPPSVNLANSAATNTTLTLTTLTPALPASAATIKHSLLILPSFGGWWSFGGGLAIAAMLLFIRRPRAQSYRLADALGACAIIAAALGCGGGGGYNSGGGGGGGGTIAATSITITLPNNKAPQGTSPLATATVTSTKPLNGTVTFWQSGSGTSQPVTPPLTLTNGTARAQLNLSVIGFYQIYAQYSGDAANLASKSASATQIITVTSYVQVSGTTGPLSRYANADVTVQ
jgi:hypothetical protein